VVVDEVVENETKLAVVLHADVVDSTRLVRLDERLAHQRIRDAFRRLADIAADHGGRTHEVRGDALVAEFDRTSDAVSAALSFQSQNKKRNESLDEGVRPVCRIGIALGEVIIADNTVTGVGVVLAQRLEQLATPGGVNISAAIREAVPGRLDLKYDDLGEHELKGFDQPQRAYAVVSNESTPTLSDGAPAVAVSETNRQPSIAVLPFDNLSSDPEQGFFADGMTEDIITGLSRFRSLLVTARNSTFAYKGKSTDVREVARALSVRYVLEGSVRCAGQRIRINAQLIDANTGNHLWAERYDRELQDIFAVQDEATDAIIAAIAPEIGNLERERAQRSPPGSLDAWGLYQHGLAAYYSSTDAGLRSAIEQFDKVNAVDSTFAPAFAMASNARWRYVVHFDPDDRNEYLSQALEKAYVAIRLDPRDPTGHWAAGEVHSILGEHDIAVSKVEEAIRLNPNDAVIHYFLGSVLRRAGRSAEAIPHFDHAMHLSPRDIWMTGMLTDRAFVLFELERYEEALEWARRARLSPSPRTMTFAIYASVLSKLGRHEEARSAADDFMKHAPGMTCTRYQKSSFGTPEAMARLVEALGEAGVPE
jgi:TolB-like protein